jgi:hypothetical protein
MLWFGRVRDEITTHRVEVTAMKSTISTILLMFAFVGSAFAQSAPTASRNPSVQAKSKRAADCKFVGTVRGTKLWAGDCTTPDQLRSSLPAAETNAPTLQDQATEAIPAGQK